LARGGGGGALGSQSKRERLIQGARQVFHSHALMASYHGIALLTNTFRDPELMSREARRLDRWLDSLG
jgi:hypothetical protein